MIATFSVEDLEQLDDPLLFQRAFWPGRSFYNLQQEVILSVRDNIETVVPAGNKLGKDYVAGFIALSFFLRPQMYFEPSYVKMVERQRNESNSFPHTRRVITTSVAERHLLVLWAEIANFIADCRVPLLANKGGPIILNHMEMRFAFEADTKNPRNYMLGQVAENPEKMAGHHAAYTLFMADEVSGVQDKIKEQADGWAKRFFLFGNPNPTNNFFRRAVDDGDLLAS